jgi:CheY-like chemotaxis protein
MVAADKRVLVVDDEQIVRDSCERVLTSAGYVVRTVSTGRDALAACRAERFDVMLTDLRMPDMDGLEIAKALSSEFPEIRIIVITGFPSQDTAEQARKIGVFDYIQKPLSPSRLAEATADVLMHPPRFTSVAYPIPELSVESAPVAAEPDLHALPAPVPTEDNVAATASEAAQQSVPSESTVPAENDISFLAAAGLLITAPLAGLAFVVFLPLVGFGMLFAVIGSRLGFKFGRKRA